MLLIYKRASQTAAARLFNFPDLPEFFNEVLSTCEKSRRKRKN